LYISAKDKRNNILSRFRKELKNFKVEVLPLGYTEEYVATLNTKPGLLALGLVQKLNSTQEFHS
jgi:alpha,alpha-trehalase